MGLFRDPLSPSRPPTAAESMGERVARASREVPVATTGKKGLALLVIGGIAVAGVVVSMLTGESAIAKGVRARHEGEARRAAKEGDDGLPQPRATPRAPAPTPAPAAAPTVPPASAAAPSPGPVPAPAPEPAGVEIPGVDLAALAGSIAFASPDERPKLRQVALEWYATFVDTPRTRRTILIDAARLAPDLVPEEEAAFARITKGAVAALPSTDAAGAAVLYLHALRDRGGPDAVIGLERVVLDEGRLLELRVAAARALPDDARLRVLKDLDTRARKQLAQADPGAKDLPESVVRELIHPSLRFALR